MAKKGRPFTYDRDADRPVTLSVRLPRALADLVKRYASEHGHLQISELIREGLEWRIGDGDPRGMGLYLAQPTGVREQAYSSNTAIGQDRHGDEALHEVRALLARQWEQIQVLAQTLERQTVADGVYSSNTARGQGHTDATRGDLQGERRADAQDESTDFDPAKHRLGKLCPQGHDWQGTGQSLRTKSQAGYCLACNAEGKRQERARKRQASPVE